MMGARSANLPWLFFVAVGAFWLILFRFARPLYDWGTGLLRQLGLQRLADFRDHLKPQVLAPARAALLIMAVLSFLFALL